VEGLQEALSESLRAPEESHSTGREKGNFWGMDSQGKVGIPGTNGSFDEMELVTENKFVDNHNPINL
jgi:hypothetical protein